MEKMDKTNSKVERLEKKYQHFGKKRITSKFVI